MSRGFSSRDTRTNNYWWRKKKCTRRITIRRENHTPTRRSIRFLFFLLFTGPKSIRDYARWAQQMSIFLYSPPIKLAFLCRFAFLTFSNPKFVAQARPSVTRLFSLSPRLCFSFRFILISLSHSLGLNTNALRPAHPTRVTYVTILRAVRARDTLNEWCSLRALLVFAKPSSRSRGVDSTHFPRWYFILLLFYFSCLEDRQTLLIRDAYFAELT